MTQHPLTLNILVLIPTYPASALQKFTSALASQGREVVVVCRTNPNEEPPTEEEYANADVLFLFQFPNSLTSIKQTPRLKLIQLASAGSNHVESSAFYKSLPERHPLIVASASGIHVVPISEHVLASVMALWHSFPRFVLSGANEKRWIPHPELLGDGFAVRELRGATIGILGYGHIGRETARMAKALGMQVIAANRAGKKSSVGGYLVKGTGDHTGDLPEAWYSTEDASSIRTFYSEADVVVNTLPSSGGTTKFVGFEAFKAMKSDAAFVNIGRGDTVDQDALIEALQNALDKTYSGDLKIGAASLDVTVPEPLGADSPLWTLKNVFITPHMSGMSTEYFVRALDLARINVQRVCDEGKGALNAVRGKGE